jgi:hypothetical protein
LLFVPPNFTCPEILPYPFQISTTLYRFENAIYYWVLLYTSSPTCLVKDNGGLDGGLVADALQSLTPLLELEGLVHDALGLDLAAVEVVDGGGEHEGLGEGADDGDLITKDLGRRPRDAGRVGVDTVADELASAADVVDGVLEDLGASGSLDNCCQWLAKTKRYYTSRDNTNRYRSRKGCPS